MLTNDVFKFFFDVAAGFSLGVLLFGVVPYYAGKRFLSWLKNRVGGKKRAFQAVQ